ncbi:MAG: threonine synthase [Prevotellaceae bacterium]|nr:threonine synthase [Prevotellaceae bacterium]
MKFYSTNGNAPAASLEEAVVRGLAPDRGLYVPESIARLTPETLADLPHAAFHEIAAAVAFNVFGGDIPVRELAQLVKEAYDCPDPFTGSPMVALKPVTDRIYALELFHGPTLAFKDVGARFMARLLGYFIRKQGRGECVNVLVATSGDTGSAVANGFLGVEGIRVHVLYPKGKVSEIQEKQFTTLGQNIVALEIDGTFDDCQALVKEAFMDEALNRRLQLTSANSINVARFLPQMFYYFDAWARLTDALPAADLRGQQVVFSVPSGNLGNLTAGLYAKGMGLPATRFIAANNRNDVFFQYLRTGIYAPRPSEATIANAMDVGDPSNFARILDLYDNSHEKICGDISGATFTDAQIAETIRSTWQQHHYLLDPHGACAYQALVDGMRPGETGIFLATAHPAKFKETVEQIIGAPVAIPDKLREFMAGTRQCVPLSHRFDDFKDYLLRTCC